MAQYKVTGQRQTTIIDSDGSLQQVWEVSYQSAGGIKGKVDVPADSYSALTVDQAISAQVDTHDAVANLGQQ